MRWNKRLPLSRIVIIPSVSILGDIVDVVLMSFVFPADLQILQIYNEKIFDLLHDTKRKHPLPLREGGGENGIHVRGLSIFRVDSKEDAFRLIRRAIQHKATRATEFNSVSSRAHTVLQLFVNIEEEEESTGLRIIKKSTLNLVDLAGSEKWRVSLSTNGIAETDVQVKEMTNINTSLHVLGNCISGLIELDRKHIPFRDSVLTRLLQSTLSGQGKSIVVATIHSDMEFVDENYSTLQFAARASKIKVSLTASVSVLGQGMAPAALATLSTDKVLADAQKTIKQLRQQLLEVRSVTAVPGLQCDQCISWEQRMQAIQLDNQQLRLRVSQLETLLGNHASKISVVNDQLKENPLMNFPPEATLPVEILSSANNVLPSNSHNRTSKHIHESPTPIRVSNKMQEYLGVIEAEPLLHIGRNGNNDSHNRSNTDISTLTNFDVETSVRQSLSCREVVASASTSNSVSHTASNNLEEISPPFVSTIVSVPNQSYDYETKGANKNGIAFNNIVNSPTSLPSLSPSTRQSPIVHSPTPSRSGGTCQKHGLEDCVLCRMFGQHKAAAPAKDYPLRSSSQQQFESSYLSSPQSYGNNSTTTCDTLTGKTNEVGGCFGMDSKRSDLTAQCIPKSDNVRERIIGRLRDSRELISSIDTTKTNVHFSTDDDGECAAHGLHKCLLCVHTSGGRTIPPSTSTPTSVSAKMNRSSSNAYSSSTVSNTLTDNNSRENFRQQTYQNQSSTSSPGYDYEINYNYNCNNISSEPLSASRSTAPLSLCLNEHGVPLISTLNSDNDGENYAFSNSQSSAVSHRSHSVRQSQLSQSRMVKEIRAISSLRDSTTGSGAYRAEDHPVLRSTSSPFPLTTALTTNLLGNGDQNQYLAPSVYNYSASHKADEIISDYADPNESFSNRRARKSTLKSQSPIESPSLVSSKQETPSQESLLATTRMGRTVSKIVYEEEEDEEEEADDNSKEDCEDKDDFDVKGTNSNALLNYNKRECDLAVIPSRRLRNGKKSKKPKKKKDSIMSSTNISGTGSDRHIKKRIVKT
jgi:hypothetical protein